MTSRRANDAASCVRGAEVAQGRGVLIAHPSPSIRLELAMALLDEHPVLLMNGTRALSRQLAKACRGVVRPPQALLLGTQELVQLVRRPLWDALAALRPTVMLIDPAQRLTPDADAVLDEPPDPTRVRELLAA